MKKSKGIQIGAMFAALLIFNMAFVPAVSAQEQVVSNIDSKEKEIKKELSMDKDSKKNFEESEKIRKHLNKIVKKDIEKSFQEQTKEIQAHQKSGQDVQILTYTSVPLGTDVTFYTADTGNKGKSSWGLAPWWYGSDYYLTSGKSEASSLVGPGGYGGVSAWSWVGKQFYVSGSGSQAANIRMAGHMWGLTSAAAGGSSSVEINLILWDASTGTEYSTPIYRKSEGGLGWTEVNSNFNNGVAVTLQGGHYYTALLEVITDASVYGAGEAGSDFGRFDGDYSGEGVWYNSITIDF